jgi:hypothetical protein
MGWAKHKAVGNSPKRSSGYMKHTRAITRAPKAAQISNLAILKEFLINLTDQIIEAIFIFTD